MNIEKKCTGCKTTKTIDNFYKNKLTTDGHSIYCVDCTKINSKKYFEKKKLRVNKIENENLIKEATYVKGKMNNIFKLSGKQFIDGLVGNVIDSPSVEDNRIKAQASKKAKAQMLATYLKFKKDIEKIVKPFNDEITGR